MRKINKIIVHCSDSSWGTEKVVDQWHKQRGWSGCGYHFVILNDRPTSTSILKSLDGAICPSRGLETVGAHCKGHNKHSIGICLIGKDTFTDAQYHSLVALIWELRSLYGHIPMFEHREFNSGKTCPNFNLDTVLNYRW